MTNRKEKLVFRHVVTGAILLFAIGLTACQLPGSSPSTAYAPPPIDPVSFDACVDQQSKVIVTQAVASGTDPVMVGYHTDINNQVIAACAPQLTPESLSDSEYSPDPNYSYVNNAVEKQVSAASAAKAQQAAEADEQQEALDAPRKAAEAAEEHKVTETYYGCLVGAVAMLSQESSEAAPVIVQAAYPVCTQQRNAAQATFESSEPGEGAGIMAVVDDKLAPTLLLDVIKDRAPASTQAP